MFGGGLRPELLRELRRFPELIFRPQMYQNVWRPGCARTRWGSLSAPPGPLAAVGIAAKQSRPVRLLPPTGFNHKSHPGNFHPTGPLFVFCQFLFREKSSLYYLKRMHLGLACCSTINSTYNNEIVQVQFFTSNS